MEAIIGILGPIIEVGKCIGGPIKRHLSYLCCFNNNIQSLRYEARKLKDADDELQKRVDAAKNNAKEIYPSVLTWLERTSQSKDIINAIENDVPKVQEGCLNLISRYSLSRKAVKTAEELRKLHDDDKFDIIAQDAPPLAVESVLSGPKEVFETRKKIEEDVMNALRNINVNIIGLCGMGGVGKTTMAKRIMDRVRVREEKLFDEALKVVVSQQVNTLRIQQDIAEQLGLTLEGENLSVRAHKIRTRLTTPKRILIVVDDVWEPLDFKDLGIPIENSSSGRCAILLTSRDRNVLDRMEAQRIFGIKILPKGEAWLLFREKTGNCVDRDDLHTIAAHVAEECKGLPLALAAIGGALRNKTSREVWEDALVQLRSSNPQGLPGVLKDVYKPLKLSYDYLESKQARSLFLLCSMFDEDVNISHEILTLYGMGLDMFEGLRNLKEARNRTWALIEVLKDRSLLLDGSNKNFVKMHDVVPDMAIHIASEEKRGGFVKMHDVVRDMAIYIASEEKHGCFVINPYQRSWENCYENCFWIRWTNIINRMEFPIELKSPSLRLLMMESGMQQLHEDESRLPDGFFYGMQELRVLSMNLCSIKLLPPTMQQLKNLKTLELHGCQSLESISVVGELLMLEILRCLICDNIKALPIEIGRLNRLRLLDIILCFNLKSIAPGIISSLVSLEELKIQNSFDRWEAKESDAKENAALVELESLTELTCLKIEINNVNLVAEEICLPSKIAKFDISIGQTRMTSGYDFEMRLEIPREMKVGNWIKTLAKSAELLCLSGDGANQLINMVEFDKLNYLYFESCTSVIRLVNTTTTRAFSLLKYLYLGSLHNLEEIIPVGHCFKNLNIIDIQDCPRLLYIFPASVADGGLTQLEVLRVIDCETIEDIFCDDKMENDGKIIYRLAFPNLKSLTLANLSKLDAQKTLDKIVVLDNLSDLRLRGLGNHDAIGSLQCLFTSLSNLVLITISVFNGIKNLMSPSIAQNLVHLERLRLNYCDKMLEVIAEDDDEGVRTMDQLCLFPNLELLHLSDLPELRSFCQWNNPNNTLHLPSLVDVSISHCPKMETFNRGFLSTPKLLSLILDGADIEIKDLNEGIQQEIKCRNEQRMQKKDEVEEEEEEEELKSEH